jgi:hypothetical protein
MAIENPTTLNLSPGTIVEIPAPAETEKDEDYFYLSKPIVIPNPSGDRTIDRLLINPKKLGGRGFFAVVSAFSKLHPEDYRTAFNLYNNVNFVQLVISRLNKIVPEDLYKMEYTDLPLLLLRASAFHYSGGSKPPTQVNGETPVTNP